MKIEDNETKLYIFVVSEVVTIIIIFIFIWGFNYNFVLLLILWKLALPPFHGWALFILHKIGWREGIFFLTWYKVIPTILILNFLPLSPLFLSLLLSLLSAFLIFNCSSLKGLLLYSSGFQYRWIILSTEFGVIDFLIYFLFYMSTLLFRGIEGGGLLSMGNLYLSFNYNWPSYTSYNLSKNNNHH